MKYLYIFILLALTGCQGTVSNKNVIFDKDYAGVSRSDQGGATDITVYQPKPLPPPAPPPPPPVASVGSPAPAPSAESLVLAGGSGIVLFRDFLYSNQPISTDTKSIILLPKKATTKNQQDKYMQLCLEWSASFYNYSENADAPADIKKVPFYWLTKDKYKSNELDRKGCTALIEAYDYARASNISRSLKLNSTKTYIVLTHLKNVVTMDLSNVDKEEDITLAIDTWKEKMIFLPTKDSEIKITTIFYSAKAVLGALGTLLAMK